MKALLNASAIVTTVTEHQAQLRERLLTLILAEGFSRFTLAELAQRLHCSKTTLYALGSSKEQVTVNAIKYYFRGVAAEVDRRAEATSGPTEKIVEYIRAIADGLRPASPQFFADVAVFDPAREVYERNVEIAAERVADFIDDGVAQGEFRAVRTAFVADVVASTMQRIQTGQVRLATGLRDADAFDQLADLVVNGIRSGHQ